jgi:hypothetical protein
VRYVTHALRRWHSSAVPGPVAGRSRARFNSLPSVQRSMLGFCIQHPPATMPHVYAASCCASAAASHTCGIVQRARKTAREKEGKPRDGRPNYSSLPSSLTGLPIL